MARQPSSLITALLLLLAVASAHSSGIAEAPRASRGLTRLQGAVVGDAAIIRRSLLAAAAPAQQNTTNQNTNTTSTNSSTPHSSPTTLQWVWDWRNGLGIAVSAVVAMLTAPGGGSGATLYMPLFNLMLGFDARTTAILTNFVVFLGAITSTAYALAEPHPVSPSRPRIDWCSVLVMTPPLLLGVQAGVILNAVIPIWLLQSATLAAFFWSLSKILRSFLKINKVEERKKKAAAAAAAAASDTAAAAKQPQQQPGSDNAPKATPAQPTRGDITADAARPTIRERLTGLPAAARTRFTAWWAIQPKAVQALTLAVLATNTAFAIASYEATTNCTPAYWGMLAASCGALLLLTPPAVLTAQWHYRNWQRLQQLARQVQSASSQLQVVVLAGSVSSSSDSDAASDNGQAEQQKQALPAEPCKQQLPSAAAAAASREAAKDYGPNWEAIQWTVPKLSYVPPVMVVVGIVSGCLGLGGGFLVSPMMLSMGLHPQCQAVTSRVILFISTFSTSLLYLIQGRLPLVYGLVHGLINLAMSPVGIWAMDRIIKITKKPSLMVLLNIGRYAVGVTLLLALSAIPNFIATAHGQLPVGFMLGAFCMERA